VAFSRTIASDPAQSSTCLGLADFRGAESFEEGAWQLLVVESPTAASHREPGGARAELAGKIFSVAACGKFEIEAVEVRAHMFEGKAEVAEGAAVDAYRSLATA